MAELEKVVDIADPYFKSVVFATVNYREGEGVVFRIEWEFNNVLYSRELRIALDEVPEHVGAELAGTLAELVGFGADQ